MHCWLRTNGDIQTFIERKSFSRQKDFHTGHFPQPCPEVQTFENVLLATIIHLGYFRFPYLVGGLVLLEMVVNYIRYVTWYCRRQIFNCTT